MECSSTIHPSSHHRHHPQTLVPESGQEPHHQPSPYSLDPNHQPSSNPHQSHQVTINPNSSAHSPPSSSSQSINKPFLSPYESPANTLTEKVDDSKLGWELWVADDLINSYDTQPLFQSQPSNQTSIGRSTAVPPRSLGNLPQSANNDISSHLENLKPIPPLASRATPLMTPAISSSHPSSPPTVLSSSMSSNQFSTPIHSFNPISSFHRPESSTQTASRPVQLDPATLSPLNPSHQSEEGSLTGIGSFSNYKPIHPLSPNPPSSGSPAHKKTPSIASLFQSSKPFDTSNTLGLVSGSLQDVSHPTGSPPPAITKDPSSRANLGAQSIYQAGSPKDPTHSSIKLDPASSVSSNTIGLANFELSKKSKPSPIPPSLSSVLRGSTGPGLPYAHAYELYDRHVSRVQPLTTSLRSPAGGMASAYRNPATVTPQKKTVPPLAAEVCLECMMRDRDMADVDVVGPGIWARESDADFEEAMLAEAAMDEQDGREGDHESSAHHAASSSMGEEVPEDSQSTRQTAKNPTVESLGQASSSREGTHESLTFSKSRPRRKRLGKGQPLTVSSLKAWTQMNPPAASHRWRTLQLYLREQRLYLELERKAKQSIEIENEKTEQFIRSNTETFAPSDSHRIRAESSSTRTDYNFLQAAAARGQIPKRASTTTLLSTGMVVETLDVSKDEKEATKYRNQDNKLGTSSSSRRMSSSSSALRNAFPHSPRSGVMSANSLSLNPELGNQSVGQYSISPGHPPASSITHSPNRLSTVSRKSGLSENFKPFSNWNRNRRSASKSVLSLAPSGSMIDMHVGLSQDFHQSSPFHSLRTPYSMGKNPSMLSLHQSDSPTGVLGIGPKPTPASFVSSPEKSRFTGIGDESSNHPKKDRKKLKHTLKGLWVKLGLSRHRSCSIDQISSPSPLGIVSSRNRVNGSTILDNEPLVPPPSLSLLAREQQGHRRNRSTLSLPLSNGRRLAPFRPQSSISGLDSTMSSPTSQHFMPSSPASKFTLNGSGPTGHPSPYIDSQHDPHFDSLAEELELSTSPCLLSSQSRSRVRSLGTASIFNELSTTHEEPGQSRRATTIELLGPLNRTRPGGAGRSDVLFTEGVIADGVMMMDEARGLDEDEIATPVLGTRAPESGVRSAAMSNSSTTTTTTTDNTTSSVRTVISKSSRIFSKLPGFSRRTSSGGNIVVPVSTTTTITSRSRFSIAGAGLSTSGGAGAGVTGAGDFRSSTSTQFTAPISAPPQPNHQESLDSSIDPQARCVMNHSSQSQRPDYLPLEKSRRGVTRSADFLALRYVSIGRETQN